jgi:hypothetical protein
MDVRKFLEDVSKCSAADSEIVLDGWLVIIDDSLYLLEEELPSDYKQAAKVRISDRRVIYAIRQAILPLGGGESFVFHRAKVIGLVIVGSSPEIIATSLYIQERGHAELAVVDITPAALDAAKTRYEAAINFDFFKEMGDT